jgi:hypothetical protein
MATISVKNRRKIQQQIVREAAFKKEVQRIVEKEFSQIHKEFLATFDNHPVTLEIKSGPRASNISRTLSGVGNLFTYIGFNEGADPIKPLRELLQTYEIKYHPKRESIRVNIDVPSKEKVFAATPLPWATGRSWARGIERGISGLGQYLVKSDKIRQSKSGRAIQVKGKIRGGKFSNIQYLSALLNDYYKKIQKIENKTF